MENWRSRQPCAAHTAASGLQVPPCSQHDGVGVGPAATAGTLPVVATVVVTSSASTFNRSSASRARFFAVQERLSAGLVAIEHSVVCVRAYRSLRHYSHGACN